MKSHKKLIGVLLIILVVGIFMPMHEAKALSPCGISIDMPECIQGIALSLVQFLLWLFSLLISAFAFLLQSAIDFSQNKAVLAPEVIHQVWGIFRDLVNMFFILVLIIMAFGTIFDVHNYTFKDMFVKFLIAALLINFSFTIMEYILSIANGLTGVFITQIGDNIGVRFSQSLMLGKISGNGIVNVYVNQMPVLITLLMFLIFAIITSGALLAASLFVIIRIGVIWLLIILSPVAWFGYTLPALKAQTWDKWWSTFISWAFFLPTYLFFIMIASIIVGAKGKIGSDIDISAVAKGSGGDIAELIFTTIGVVDLLYFSIAILFLIGGIKAAFSVGNFAANGAGAVMKFAQGRVKSIPLPGTGKMFGGRMMSASDLEKGAGGLYGTFKEKGFSQGTGLKWLYSGKPGEERGEEAAKNRFEQMFGYRGKGIVAPKAERDAIKHDKEHMEEEIANGNTTAEDIYKHLKSDEIVDALGNLDTHMVAAYELSAQKGLLKPDQFKQLMGALSGKNPLMARDLAATYFKGNLKEMKEGEIREIVSPPAGSIYESKQMSAVRKELAQLLMSDEGKSKLRKIEGTPDQQKKFVDDVVRDFGGKDSNESKGFLKHISKVRPDIVIKRDGITGDSDDHKERREALYKDNFPTVKEDLAGLQLSTWTDEPFKKEFKRRLGGMNKKQLDKYKESMGNVIFEAGGDDAKEKLDHFNEMLKSMTPKADEEEPAKGPDDIFKPGMAP